jgi:hypothetical protein
MGAIGLDHPAHVVHSADAFHGMSFPTGKIAGATIGQNRPTD